MSLFAPDFGDPDPSLGQRAGRLCYWAGLAGAAGWGVLFFIALRDEPDFAYVIAGLSALSFIVGRALCYLFGGE